MPNVPPHTSVPTVVQQTVVDWHDQIRRGVRSHHGYRLGGGVSTQPSVERSGSDRVDPTRDEDEWDREDTND